MENPRCVGDDAAAVASNCYEEYSQPNVDESKQELAALSCPGCENVSLLPHARFCHLCGSKLQLDNVAKQKGILFLNIF